MKKSFSFLLIFVSFSVFSQNIDSTFYLNTIDDDFLGTYLPIGYINSLYETGNHSISMHLNDRGLYHDVLSVNQNIIYSNLKWHDQYAVPAAEGKNYQFIKNDEGRIIIDNNGYSYRKIGDDPFSYSTAAGTFVANIIFKDVIEQGIGVYAENGKVIIPFLHFFLNEDTYLINLDDMFYEKGANILLYDRNTRLMIYVAIDKNEYIFYQIMTHGSGSINNRSDDILFKYDTNEDISILYAMAGFGEEVSEEYLRHINELDEYGRRIIINAMFALNGYMFVTEQWQIFFLRYSWYSPKSGVRNDSAILNVRQKRLLEYLNR
jgi:hypothetical protein